MLTTVQHHIRQLSINQWSIKNDNLNHVLTNVYQDFQKITSNNVINSNACIGGLAAKRTTTLQCVESKE